MALINQPPIGSVQDSNGLVQGGWSNFFSATYALLAAMTQSGTTAQRPTSFLWVGRPYFDTTLGIPIWRTAAAWVDATGAVV